MYLNRGSSSQGGRRHATRCRSCRCPLSHALRGLVVGPKAWQDSRDVGQPPVSPAQC